MANVSLAARYRPQTFAQVVGQDMVKSILSRAAAENKVAPAYLLSGTRGVGKTTLARIFAKALNCEHAPTAEPCNECENCRRITQGSFVDVVEIDGASNRGIEDVRRLRDAVGYAPLEGRYKVIIIDEAHMLTKEAFNALLKTLEEPPARVVFIMATTEQHKFPITIVSRCQHFIFRQIPEQTLEQHVTSILEREHRPFEPEAVHLIARRAAGSVRDAMSLLGQTLAFMPSDSEMLTQARTRDVLGLAGLEIMDRLLSALQGKDVNGITVLVRDLLAQGVDMGFFLRELGTLWRNLFILHEAGDAADLPPAERARLSAYASSFSLTYIHAAWQMTLDNQRRILQSLEPAAGLELLLLNLAMLPRLLPIEDLGSAALSGGVPTGTPVSKSPAKVQSGQPLGQSLGQANVQTPGQPLGQANVQTPGQPLNQATVQTPGQPLGQPLGQTNVQPLERPSAQPLDSTLRQTPPLAPSSPPPLASSLISAQTLDRSQSGSLSGSLSGQSGESLSGGTQSGESPSGGTTPFFTRPTPSGAEQRTPPDSIIKVSLAEEAVEFNTETVTESAADFAVNAAQDSSESAVDFYKNVGRFEGAIKDFSANAAQASGESTADFSAGFSADFAANAAQNSGEFAESSASSGKSAAGSALNAARFGKQDFRSAMPAKVAARLNKLNAERADRRQESAVASPVLEKKERAPWEALSQQDSERNADSWPEQERELQKKPLQNSEKKPRRAFPTPFNSREAASQENFIEKHSEESAQFSAQQSQRSSESSAAQSSGQNSAQGFGSNPVQNLGQGSAQSFGSKPVQNLGQNSAQGFGSNPVQNLGQGSAQSFGSNPVQNLGQGSEPSAQNSTQNSGQNSVQNFGRSVAQNSGKISTKGVGYSAVQSSGQNSIQSVGSNTAQSFGRIAVQSSGQSSDQNFTDDAPVWDMLDEYGDMPPEMEADFFQGAESERLPEVSPVPSLFKDEDAEGEPLDWESFAEYCQDSGFPPEYLPYVHLCVPKLQGNRCILEISSEAALAQLQSTGVYKILETMLSAWLKHSVRLRFTVTQISLRTYAEMYELMESQPIVQSLREAFGAQVINCWDMTPRKPIRRKKREEHERLAASGTGDAE